MIGAACPALRFGAVLHQRQIHLHEERLVLRAQRRKLDQDVEDVDHRLPIRRFHRADQSDWVDDCLFDVRAFERSTGSA